MQQSSGIPLRNFGKTGVKISALGLGGHHLGAAKDETTAVELVHRAFDGGVTFYDCCWECIGHFAGRVVFSIDQVASQMPNTPLKSISPGRMRPIRY